MVNERFHVELDLDSSFILWSATIFASVIFLIMTSHCDFCVLVFASLLSTRQHPSYGDCLEVKREYYQNSSVLDCVTQCSQSAAHLYEQFLRVKQIGFVTL